MLTFLQLSKVNKWVGGLNLQVDLRRGGTAQGPPCKRNRRVRKGGKNNYDVLLDKVSKTIAELDQMMVDAEAGEAPGNAEASSTASPSESSVKDHSLSERSESVNGAQPHEETKKGDRRARQASPGTAFAAPIAIQVEPKRQRSRRPSVSRREVKKDEPLFHRCEDRRTRRREPKVPKPRSNEIEDLSDNESSMDDGHWDQGSATDLSRSHKRTHSGLHRRPGSQRKEQLGGSANQERPEEGAGDHPSKRPSRSRMEETELILPSRDSDLGMWHAPARPDGDDRLRSGHTMPQSPSRPGVRSKGAGLRNAAAQEGLMLGERQWSEAQPRHRVRRWGSPQESASPSQARRHIGEHERRARDRYPPTRGVPQRDADMYHAHPEDRWHRSQRLSSYKGMAWDG
eukprot:scaffold3707_cov228-Pinguiococcus_pyrenoidosus.AAC.6